jgi:hypothetical protein
VRRATTEPTFSPIILRLRILARHRVTIVTMPAHFARAATNKLDSCPAATLDRRSTMLAQTSPQVTGRPHGKAWNRVWPATPNPIACDATRLLRHGSTRTVLVGMELACGRRTHGCASCVTALRIPKASNGQTGSLLSLAGIDRERNLRGSCEKL